MTVRTLTAPMPIVTVVPNMILKLEAISPTTGAAVTGVVCSAWAIYGQDAPAETGDDTPAGPFMLTPGPESVAA